MARRFGELILLVNSRTFPRLRFQLKGWLEEVDVETGRFVESTQCRGFTEAFQPPITNQLANNRPVLLFDPCLVVLSIGAAAGEDDALLLAIVPQRVVHECAVVVCIKTEQGKWESAPQTGNGFHNDGSAREPEWPGTQSNQKPHPSTPANAQRCPPASFRNEPPYPFP